MAVQALKLSDAREATYEVVGEGRPTLMLPGGPGFAAEYMRRDAELFSDVLQSYLIDPHGSGGSTPPTNPTTDRPVRSLESVLFSRASDAGLPNARWRHPVRHPTATERPSRVARGTFDGRHETHQGLSGTSLTPRALEGFRD